MKEIEAARLVDCSLENPVDAVRARAVLPFFSEEYRTKFLLVVPTEGRIFVTRDLPTGVVSRSLAFRRRPRKVRVEQVHWRELGHFDSHWLVRDRKDLPANVRKAIVAGNLAGKQLPEGTLEMVWFDYALLGVTSARIGNRRLPVRRLSEALLSLR